MSPCPISVDPHLQNYAWSWGRAVDRARQMLPLVAPRSLPAVSCAPLTVTGGWHGEERREGELRGEQLSREPGQLRAVNSGQCLECQTTARPAGRIWKQISWISLLSQIRLLKIATNDKTESDLSPIELCLPRTHKSRPRLPRRLYFNSHFCTVGGLWIYDSLGDCGRVDSSTPAH